MTRKKIVLIRLDKIGDLICTLPVDQILNSEEYEITWVVQKGMGQVVDLGARKRNYFELDKNDPKNSALRLSNFLSEIKPDIGISFQAPWWANFELFKARVPVRSGVRSQWHSFIFLNDGLRQKRSLATQHELDYNLDLVRHTLDLKPTREFLFFQIAPPTDQKVLNYYDLKPQNYIVVHPGMMGSALNWKQSQYISYIHEQLSKKKKIVITGTKSDESYLTEIKKEFSNNPNVQILQSQLDLDQLVQVLAFAEKVVAPSTGVAHLAASVGVKTQTIFSPIRVHHPRRWAPRGPDVEIFLPQVTCPAAHQCLGKNCIHFNCMDQVGISQ